MHGLVRSIAASGALFLLSGQAPAQRGELVPEVAQSLVVEVQILSLSSQGEMEPAMPATGTIFGHRGDTLYIATSAHQLDGAAEVYVRFSARGNRIPAVPVRIEPDPTVDLAVLAVTRGAAGGDWRRPRMVGRTAERGYVPEESVFALGCPAGVCWARPEAGSFYGSSGPRIAFRSLFLEPGLSGGPLVDKNGALLGIVLEHTEGVGEALSWPYVADVLESWGYPVNLPDLRGYRQGEKSYRLLGSVFPLGGTNSDGRRIFGGARLEYAQRLRPQIEVAAGLNRVSFAATPYADREDDYHEAFVHTYLHAGLRYAFALPWWSIGRRLPDAASFGIDVLFPPVRETRVVGMAPTDSVDIRTGEYVDIRTTIESRTGLSFAGRFAYRVAVTDRIGLYLAPSMYLMNFDYLDSSPFRGFLELGTDFRSP